MDKLPRRVFSCDRCEGREGGGVDALRCVKGCDECRPRLRLQKSAAPEGSG